MRIEWFMLPFFRQCSTSRDLTRLFQGTKIRALRGFCPLNSNR